MKMDNWMINSGWAAKNC